MEDTSDTFPSHAGYTAGEGKPKKGLEGIVEDIVEGVTGDTDEERFKNQVLKVFKMFTGEPTETFAEDVAKACEDIVEVVTGEHDEERFKNQALTVSNMFTGEPTETFAAEVAKACFWVCNT